MSAGAVAGAGAAARPRRNTEDKAGMEEAYLRNAVRRGAPCGVAHAASVAAPAG